MVQASSTTKRITANRMLKHTALALAVVLTVALAAGCNSASKTTWGTGIGAATGAAAGALVAGDDDRLAGALIGGAVGAGTGYLIGSHLDKQDQRAVMQEYNQMIQMQDRNQVNQRINSVADGVIGDGNGTATAGERNTAIQELGYALDTAADEAGNRDGSTDSLERQRYIQKYSDRPLVQILTGQPAPQTSGAGSSSETAKEEAGDQKAEEKQTTDKKADSKDSGDKQQASDSKK